MPTVDNQLRATTSRRAGRLNAAHISEQEHRALTTERQSLLDKLLDGAITKREQNRLEYVRWSLDRIEDAKYGYALDQLEVAVQRYEQFRDDIVRLQQQIADLEAKPHR